MKAFRKSSLKPSALVLIWALGIISTLVAIAYLSVEILLQSSYRNLALGHYSVAAENSARAVLIAQLLYPASSKYYQNIFLYDVKVWSKLGIIGGSFGTGLKNFTVVKTLRFEKENVKALTREEMARIQVEGARIANATTHGEGVSLVNGLIDKSQSSNDIWSAYAKEERAYADLAGFFAVLAPNNAEQRKRNYWVVESVSKEHKTAQEVICKSDVVQCRFNNLRWQIGTCIRRAYLNEAPVCAPDTFRDVSNFAGWNACKDLSVDQCYSVMNDLLPYYHSLLQAQGKGVLDFLSLQIQVDQAVTNLSSDKKQRR